jgi:Undecaprenyl-phosphate glucose phosphotransferase
MIRENQEFLNRIQLVLDAGMVFISIITAFFVRFQGETAEYLPVEYYLRASLFLIPLYLFLYYLFDLYEPRRIKGLTHELVIIIKSNLISLAVLLSILFIFKFMDFSRMVLFLFIIINIVLTTLERVSIRLFLQNIRKKGYNIKYILVIGADEHGQEFVKKIKANKQLGFSVIGFLDDNKNKGRKIKDIEVIGKINDLDKILAETFIDEVIIALSIKDYDRLKDIIAVCEKNGVKTRIIPDYIKYIPSRPSIDEIDGLPLINIRRIPLDNLGNKFSKRLLDIAVSLTGLILVSPILLIVALLVKLESPGPVIFKQERVGLNRKIFQMYKFRSMKVQDKKEEEKQWTTENDPRKTKVGTFIRKTSIDELPQLFNVLKGDMSLIGPRPERPYFVEQFKEKIPKYMIKHQVRPGITGWAQVNGWRGDTSIEERIKHDIYYIENWSLALDIKIILLTIVNGFINKNAY